MAFAPTKRKGLPSTVRSSSSTCTGGNWGTILGTVVEDAGEAGMGAAGACPHEANTKLSTMMPRYARRGTACLKTDSISGRPPGGFGLPIPERQAGAQRGLAVAASIL